MQNNNPAAISTANKNNQPIYTTSRPPMRNCSQNIWFKTSAAHEGVNDKMVVVENVIQEETQKVRDSSSRE
jgi:hypothetical protein